ncbi:MAG TPA: bifunctional shikimate kinase/3-dehydroquinate synthase [Gaiellaceae bacterium]|nr:bifunctional shikimate kinase/3-dehydroquinate synthase [Gaiellaceae bacterium]
MATALDRHIALIGFMGAGKSTLGFDVASRIDRPFVDLDREIERGLQRSIPELFREEGEAGFRVIEAGRTVHALCRERPAVLALGGGAVETPGIRKALQENAITVLVDVEVGRAWERVRRSARPLAQDEEEFRALYERRRVLYEEAADARARDADDVVLAALGIRFGVAEPAGDVLIVDERVRELHGFGLDQTIAVREKTLAEAERVWRELRIGRDGTIVAAGGGTTTDLAGFVAASYMRGVRWSAVPTTLVGQVDAAIGGKTAVDLPEGKNLVGAFHYPDAVVIDPALLATLPEQERRNGLAEVVKIGLLAGRSVWELEEAETIRACAAFKASICLADPYEQKGRREILNLGHTFGHALEAASDYELPHGEAVALGLSAALRLSGLGMADVLDVHPVRVDRERAWAALQRDKKARDGKIRLVLLEELGRPVVREVDPGDVRLALDELIAD